MKKKTFKAILAAALAVLMVIPYFSAFAANDTLIWDFYGSEYTYDYAGEMTVGTTAIPEDSSDYIWYSFDVPEAGYYYINFSYENMDAWLGIPEEFEGTSAYDEKSSFCYSPENKYGLIYYLEAGKTIVGLDLYYFEEDATFETEYLGAEITEIKPQHDLIYNYDVYDYEYEGEYFCDFSVDFDIIFSEGKTITTYFFEGTSDKTIAPGENTFKIELFGKEFEFTSNVYYTEDYVESVEISNIEDYLCVYEYYNGTDYSYPLYETIRVKFKDGTTYTVNINDSDTITLPNGREVYYGFDFRTDDNGNYVFDVYVGGKCFASYECETKAVSVEENVGQLTEAAKNHLSDVSYYLRRAFEVAFEGGLLGFFDYGMTESLLRIEWAVTSFVAVFEEITNLMLYMFA